MAPRYIIVVPVPQVREFGETKRTIIKDTQAGTSHRSCRYPSLSKQIKTLLVGRCVTGLLFHIPEWIPLQSFGTSKTKHDKFVAQVGWRGVVSR